MQKIFKIMLVTLCLLIGISPKKVTAEEPVTSNSTTTIDSFTITNAEQTYSPNVNEKNHVVKYTLALSTSGDDGSIKSTTIELPKTLFNNRSGEVGDEFKVSIPTKEEYENATSQGIEVDSMWMYEDKGNSIVISSIKPLKTGTTYNIEFGYELSGSISGFRDGETAKTLEAKIKMDTAGGELHTTTTAEEVTINTSVTLLGSKSDADSIQAITDEWQDIWGTKPADADDYLYSQVRVSSFISGSQPYTMTINSKAVDKETGEEFTPYMYSIGVSGWKTGNTEENSLLFNNTNGRNDYVLYRFPKATYGTKDTINFKVTNEVITQGADNLDPASEPSISETTIQYSKEPWQVEKGDFITLQNGDNYFRVNSKEMEKWSNVNVKIDKYSRFDLQNFQNGTLTKYDGLDFGQFMYGRPAYHTVPNGLPVTPENYFKENVTYTQFVNGIGLVSEDKTELQSMLDEAQAKFDKIKEYFDVSTTVCKNLEFVEKVLAENPVPVLPDLTNNETLSNSLDGIMTNMYAHYNAVDASTPLDLEDVKNYVHDKAFLKAMEQAKEKMVAKLETMQQEYDNATDKTALETPLAEQKARVKTVSDFINSAIATLKDYLASVTNESYVVRHNVSLEEVLKKKEEPKKEEEKPVEEETPKQEEKKEEDKQEEKKEVKSSKKENIPTGVESYFLTYVGLALVSGAGVYKLTKE